MTYREKKDVDSCITCITYIERSKAQGVKRVCFHPYNTPKEDMEVAHNGWCPLYDRAMRYRIIRDSSDNRKKIVSSRIRKFVW